VQFALAHADRLTKDSNPLPPCNHGLPQYGRSQPADWRPSDVYLLEGAASSRRNRPVMTASEKGGDFYVKTGFDELESQAMLSVL